jgi:preprotein translocase subunit SecY
LTVAFTYFYTDVMFRQQNLPETLQKQGGFIPGIRPARAPSQYLNGVLVSASRWWARSSWASWRCCRS